MPSYKPLTILNPKTRYSNRKKQTKYFIWQHSVASTTDGYFTVCQWRCNTQKVKKKKRKMQKNNDRNKTFTNVCYIFNIILSVTLY